MALPIVKVACSNGHFQESLQNFGDRGTWTAIGSYSGGNTKLTNKNANWVADEWIGYELLCDTNDGNTIATVVDNDEISITVNEDKSSLSVGDSYRIGGGIVGTVTANGSSSANITITGVKDKWGNNITPLTDEFKNMKFVPDKLDGTAYTINSNTTTGSNTTVLTIDTSIVVTATSCEIGRGASTSLLVESINISAELNEPKQLSAEVVYDVVGTNKFEQEKDIDNPLMLGSTVRVTESTGGKILFDGLVQSAPTTIDADNRVVQFSAYDKLQILDYTMIPSTTIESDGTLPSYSFHKGTPLIESGLKGWESDNKIYQTKAFEDFSFVPQPFAYAGSVNTNGTYATKTSGGSTAGAVLEPDSGTPFLTDLIKPGCVVINATTKRITYIKTVNDNNTITCTDALRDGSNPFWTSGDEYIIISKNWQVGEGIESDSDYTTNQGWEILGRTREILYEPYTSLSQYGATTGSEDSTKNASQIYVGKYNTSTTATDDVFMSMTGRAWALLIHNDYVELVHYNGYTYDHFKSKYLLNAYNQTPYNDRNTRADLTNAWDTSLTGTSANYRGREWASGSYLIELFPNRFGGDAPKIYSENSVTPVQSIGVVASEGVIKMDNGDDKWDGQDALYCHQYSYDGDASSSPDKGTTDDSLDISDIVQIAVQGLTDTSANDEEVISKSKLAGGAGLRFDTTNSQDTGLKINTLRYEAFSDSQTPLNPKRLIEKLCDDSGLLYDLRFDDHNDKVIFKPLQQKASADISLSAGSVTSLTRERDVSDVYSSLMMQIQTPDQNYFAPTLIAQHGTGINSSGTSAQTGFTKGSYSSGSSIPDYFWDITHLRGLGPDVKVWNSATYPQGTQSPTIFFQSIWKKSVWKTTGRNSNNQKRIDCAGPEGITSLDSDGNPLHLITMWFQDGVALDIDSFRFSYGFCGDGMFQQSPGVGGANRFPGGGGTARNGATYRVEVSTDFSSSNPLNTATNWQRFNDNSVAITSNKGTKLNNCQVKGVKAIRILALKSPFAQPGWWGEGREMLRDTNADYGYKTYGYGGAAECFTARSDNHCVGRRPKWNNNAQDAWGYSVDPGDIEAGLGGLMQAKPLGTTKATTAFVNAIENSICAYSGTTTPNSTTLGNYDERGGYTQLGNFLYDFEVTGIGKKAMFIRIDKNQTTKNDTERNVYSPTYKKIASMGYKTEVIPLENFSVAEGQTLGQRFLDDKLRRYEARDYSLNGLSPFVNSNNLPVLGQTISIADDTTGTSSGGAYSGIITQYQFEISADGTRFDFRLEDYDTRNTATYIQAK